MKLANWDRRLIAYLGRVKAQAFDRDRFHCATFASGAVAAMTGRDLVPEWSGLGLAAGMRAIRAAGYVSPVDVVAAHLPEVPIAMAQAGDVAVVPTGDGPALGIVQGAQIYVLRANGLGLVGLLSAARAFRV